MSVNGSWSVVPSIRPPEQRRCRDPSQWLAEAPARIEAGSALKGQGPEAPTSAPTSSTDMARTAAVTATSGYDAPLEHDALPLANEARIKREMRVHDARLPARPESASTELIRHPDPYVWEMLNADARRWGPFRTGAAPRSSRCRSRRDPAPGTTSRLRTSAMHRRACCRQTFRDWTAIVVNDGSSGRSHGGTRRLIQSLGDPRFAHVRSENRGVSAARTLHRDWRGPFVALLDPDDLWVPAQARKTTVGPAAEDCRDRVAVRTPTTSTATTRTSSMHAAARPRPGLRRRRRHGGSCFGRTSSARTPICCDARPASRSVFRRESSRALEDKDPGSALLMTGKVRDAPARRAGRLSLHGSNTSKNVDKMLAGRLDLVRKIDRLVADLPQMEGRGLVRPQARWSHAFEEAVETHLGGGASTLRRCASRRPRYLGVLRGRPRRRWSPSGIIGPTASGLTVPRRGTR